MLLVHNNGTYRLGSSEYHSAKRTGQISSSSDCSCKERKRNHQQKQHKQQLPVTYFIGYNSIQLHTTQYKNTNMACNYNEWNHAEL
eukprot:m.117783 g.117783  ORF g.117783 m.117783 type:complete len:86 (+) comp12881_c0_seq2:208-465(+)